MANEHFDTVVVGTGFGSSFFLLEWLKKRKNEKILVVEWGDLHPHDWQIANKRNSAINVEDTFVSRSSKPWNYTIGFGGGTNCWHAQTPRLHPSDFRLKSRYGVGVDWPLDYDELEPFYTEAEQIMSISGDPDMTVIYPRSAPYPQPPHRLTSVDKVMKKAQPNFHFAIPTARARQATSQRSACCASFRCQLCPVNAKFTALNGLDELYSSSQITLCVNAKAKRYVASSNSVQKLVFEHGGKEFTVSGNLFVLGANAIQSPAILLRSDMGGGLTGLGLHESAGSEAEAFLDGLDNFDGSTQTTALNYSLYDGAFRANYGAALICFENRWTARGLRAEKGRWRQTLPLMIIVEDLLEDKNTVTVDSRGEAVVTFGERSEYATRGLREAFNALPKLLSPLPVEEIFFRADRPTESHLQGTLRIGNDPQASVVDGKMIHHRWRNLVVVGTSVFPTCSVANPSLTAAALSLRTAAALAS